MFMSSSFQTHSIPLLHILSSFDKSIPVYFLETGFHFPETRVFRDEIVKLLDLNLVIIESPVPKISQRDESEHFYFISDPDRCCFMNKVLPLQSELAKYDIWISGLRRDQTRHRQKLKTEEKSPHGATRYHPMLDWSSKVVWQYRVAHDLPEHPLEARGFQSIGCAPCTRKFVDSESARDSRWAGRSKEECGIHTELIVK